MGVIREVGCERGRRGDAHVAMHKTYNAPRYYLPHARLQTRTQVSGFPACGNYQKHGVHSACRVILHCATTRQRIGLTSCFYFMLVANSDMFFIIFCSLSNFRSVSYENVLPSDTQ